jgi:hypothetical protein
MGNVHGLGRLNVELASTQEPQQGQSVQSLGIAQLLQLRAELLDLLILLRRGVAWVTRLRLRRGGGEVVIVILGVENKGLLYRGRHCDDEIGRIGGIMGGREMWVGKIIMREEEGEVE